MFCPQCQAEYRPGFTRCADCDVELVNELPSKAVLSSEQTAPGDQAEDPFCSFWSGDDPRIHAELCELLDKESIPHKTVRREDHLFHISKYPAFQVGIPFSMFERAEAIVKEAYDSGEEPPDALQLLPYAKARTGTSRSSVAWLPAPRGFAWSSGDQQANQEAQATTSSEEPPAEIAAENSRPDWDPEGWDPEGASVEVWSGDSVELTEMLAVSLRENRIYLRRVRAGGGEALFVLPEEETRAREIVREVIEGVPPE